MSEVVKDARTVENRLVNRDSDVSVESEIGNWPSSPNRILLRILCGFIPPVIILQHCGEEHLLHRVDPPNIRNDDRLIVLGSGFNRCIKYLILPQLQSTIHCALCTGDHRDAVKVCCTLHFKFYSILKHILEEHDKSHMVHHFV